MSAEALLANLRTIAGGLYDIKKVLKSGGQGSVALAEREGREVALKALAVRSSGDLVRLKRELEALKRVEHPNIVRVLYSDIARYGQQVIPLVGYEFIPDGDLSDRIVATGPLDVTSLATVGRDIGRAVETLWSNRIVHRDIKPANVMCRGGDGFVLVDLGLAQHLNLQTITPRNASVGTLGYMPLEQVGRRVRLSVQADMFSLGVTLYEAATRTHPWGGDQAKIGGPYPPLRSVREDLPSAFCALVARMLRARAVLRPTLVSEDFARLLEG